MTDDHETWTPTIPNCDQYLSERTGCYEYRKWRYDAAAFKMAVTRKLTAEDTLVDVGAGWTELDYCLRTQWDWRGRYIPIDGGIDGTDLNSWHPSREAEWFVALEIIEHLYKPRMLLEHLKMYALKGVILSTPNPRTTDVLGMDPTHMSIIQPDMLIDAGFQVEERSFYGQHADSLFAWWTT